MAPSTRGKDVVLLTDEDYKSKKYKTAPGGTYTFKINRQQSKIVPGAKGNLLKLCITITKGPHKGVNVFDNIAPHVGWKIAQLLKAFGIKKTGKLTLQDVLKMILAKGEVRAVISEGEWQKKAQNKVTQYLPLGKGGEEDEDEAPAKKSKAPAQTPVAKKRVVKKPVKKIVKKGRK